MALAVAALLAPSAAMAFWFLPGFEPASAREAREDIFAPGGTSAAGIAGTAATPPDAAPEGPGDAPLVEGSLTMATAPSGASSSEGGQDTSIPATTDASGFTSNAPADIAGTSVTALGEGTGGGVETDATPGAGTEVTPEPTLVTQTPGILDFDLEALAAYQGRLEPVVTAGPLSDHELDLVLSPQRFDMTYDLSDGAVQPALGTFPISVFLEVEAGDTLSAMFQNVGISIYETQKIALALRDQDYNIAQMQPGQLIELELDGAIEPFGENRIQSLSLSPGRLERIKITRVASGLVGEKTEIQLNRALVHAAGALTTGAIYVDDKALGINGIVPNYVAALNSQIDFSRIQSVGDEIEVIYEAYFDDDGKLKEFGNVLYASFHDQYGETYEAFRFENNGKAAYFTRDARFTGQTNTLMRKPVGGGRMTSPFGLRTHPVYGDRRMHNGVDYGASCGTPIYAAGDGIIRFAGWKGGYGKFISIKHGSTYATNYAHMRSFANGMRPGVRVRKGQLIGRVGTTGASTGCHLHYEVVKNGRHINPLSDHIPRGNDLTSAAKTRFLAFVAQLDTERENGVTFDQAMARARSGIY